MSDEKLTPKQEIEKRRADRRAAEAEAAEVQEVADLTAIDALEERYGDSNVAVMTIAYVAGLPTKCACRAPAPAELKRYRDQVRPRREQKGGRERPADVDYVAPAEMLAVTTLVYPSEDVFEKMCLARPGLAAQLGLQAVNLASAREEDEGKG